MGNNINDIKLLEKLQRFTESLKFIEPWDNYCEPYLPEIAQIKDNNSGMVNELFEQLSAMYLNGNDGIIVRSLNYLKLVIDEMTAADFKCEKHGYNGIQISDNYADQYLKDGIYSLQTLIGKLSGLPPLSIDTKPDQTRPQETDISGDPTFDNTIKINTKNDTRRVMFLYEFHIIDHLQRMGYSNNQIGVILMDLFELSENEKKNRYINIGSLISKIQNKTPGNPYDSDTGRDFVADLEQKFEIKSRKKQ